MNMIMGGGLMGGGIPGMGGGDDKADEGEKTESGEDPEVVQARLEAEEKRKEKHRLMEEEREKMRQGIRDKYGIKKKEELQAEMMPDCEGRIGASRKKSPEELANEVHEDDDSLLGQLGLGGAVDKAKTAVGGVCAACCCCCRK